MSSDKFFSADNQQERLGTSWWIVGIVDGEGSFLVNVFKSPKTRMKWQVFPEFNISQAGKDLSILKRVKDFFECGYIYHNKGKGRKKNWKPLYKYCVRDIKSLDDKIIPFFKKFPLGGKAKKRDFKKFSKVINLIKKKRHLTIDGMKKVVEIRNEMSHRKPFNNSSPAKFLKSSETIRQAFYSTENRRKI